jgi:hypothetical protein
LQGVSEPINRLVLCGEELIPVNFACRGILSILKFEHLSIYVWVRGK